MYLGEVDKRIPYYINFGGFALKIREMIAMMLSSKNADLCSSVQGVKRCGQMNDFTYESSPSPPCTPKIEKAPSYKDSYSSAGEEFGGSEELLDLSVRPSNSSSKISYKRRIDSEENVMPQKSAYNSLFF